MLVKCWPPFFDRFLKSKAPKTTLEMINKMFVRPEVANERRIKIVQITKPVFLIN